tara:strand:+ start:355 stop:1839 length:1485 start_codon:yes stop_codon:yes gene_type:complete
MKLSKKPIAIIKMGDRSLKFVKINKTDAKYFTTKDGMVFEVDDEYEYRFNKTGIYFYNHSNSKPIDLLAINEVDDTLKGSGESELFNKSRFMASISDDPNIDPSKLSLPADLENLMSPDTKRFLQDYSTDSEVDKTNVMINVHNKKKALTRFSSGLLGMGMNRGDFAFVQIGYKKIDIVPMYIDKNNAYTKYGVFEVVRDNVYFLKKQMLCFFIASNEKDDYERPMPKPAERNLKTMYRKKRFNLMGSFLNPIGSKEEKKPRQKSVSLSTEKKLIQHQADNPSVYYTTLKELHLSKEAVATKLSDPLKKVIPIALIFGGVMGIAVVMSNLPPVIDTAAEYAGIVPPRVVYLSPEEAAKAGLDVDHIPLGMTKAQFQEKRAEERASGGVPIVDTEAPQLLLPAPESLVFEADNWNGYKVKYSVGVLDNVDEGLIAECDKPSGMVFPIQDNPTYHTITCTATDASGNKSQASFEVTITVREGIERGSLVPQIQPMP